VPAALPIASTLAAPTPEAVPTPDAEPTAFASLRFIERPRLPTFVDGFALRFFFAIGWALDFVIDDFSRFRKRLGRRDGMR
jgi:hypothetical protein